MDNELFNPDELQDLLENMTPTQFALDEKASAEFEASQKRCEEYIKKKRGENEN